MDRQTAWGLVTKHVSNKNLHKHMRAVEAVMKSLAVVCREDPEVWGLAGLLHDLDYDQTADNFARHGYRTAEMLANEDVPEEVIRAIQCHPGHLPRETKMDMALYAADPVTGLITAAALMHPAKKLQGVDLRFLLRRFRETRFAAGANRDQIKSCSGLGIDVEDFLSLSLNSMQEISGELGL